MNFSFSNQFNKSILTRIQSHRISCSITKLLCSLMESTLFNVTFTCTIIITLNLCMFELFDMFSFEMLIGVLDVYLVLGLTFAYYYLAEQITSDLSSIEMIFYKSAWYHLKTKHQRLIVLPIQRAQRDVRLTGLGLFECSLPVFSAVCKNISIFD